MYFSKVRRNVKVVYSTETGVNAIITFQYTIAFVKTKGVVLISIDLQDVPTNHRFSSVRGAEFESQCL